MNTEQQNMQTQQNVQIEGGKKRNPWLTHVMKYMKEHPNLKLKDVLKQASKTYKRSK